MLVWQSVPLNPGAHVHANPFTPSTHVAPEAHGTDAHSLMFV